MPTRYPVATAMSNVFGIPNATATLTHRHLDTYFSVGVQWCLVENSTIPSGGIVLMSAVMAQRKRVILLLSPETHAALKSVAAERGFEMSEFADRILQEALQERVDRIRRAQGKKGGKGSGPPPDPAADPD